MPHAVFEESSASSVSVMFFSNHVDRFLLSLLGTYLVMPRSMPVGLQTGVVNIGRIQSGP